MKSRNTILIAGLLVVAAVGLATAASYYTGFEDNFKTSYAVGNASFSNVVWTLDSVVTGNLTADKKEGTNSLRMAANGTNFTVVGTVTNYVPASAYMAETLTGSYAILNFKYAAYGTASFLLDGRLAADFSTDDGMSWNTLMQVEVHSSDQALAQVGTSFGPYDYVRLRFRFWDVTCTFSRQRVNVDTVELIIPEPGSLLIAGAMAAGLLALLRRK